MKYEIVEVEEKIVEGLEVKTTNERRVHGKVRL